MPIDDSATAFDYMAAEGLGKDKRPETCRSGAEGSISSSYVLNRSTKSY